MLANVTCTPGHRYSDGYVSKYISCINFIWVPQELEPCLGIHINGKMQFLSLAQLSKPTSTLLFFPETPCPPAPFVEYAFANSTLAHYGSVVEYQCEKGLWFADIRTNKMLIVCQADRTWNGELHGCSGSH